MAQEVEHFLGKEEVTSSNLVISSNVGYEFHSYPICFSQKSKNGSCKAYESILS